jgi:hypothetical protein
VNDELAEPRLEHLVAAWRSLPPREQRVLWHFAVLGEPEDQVAERVGEVVTAHQAASSLATAER